jgi:hypothetical protein
VYFANGQTDRILVPYYSRTSYYTNFFSAECESVARDWLDNVYEPEMRVLTEIYVQKEWEYNTNINDLTAQAAVSHMADMGATGLGEHF